MDGCAMNERSIAPAHPLFFTPANTLTHTLAKSRVGCCVAARGAAPMCDEPAPMGSHTPAPAPFGREASSYRLASVRAGPIFSATTPPRRAACADAAGSRGDLKVLLSEAVAV